MDTPVAVADEGAMTTAPYDVALCILTCLRPVGLERLFGHLVDLAVPPGCRIRCVVVDNDSDGSARPVIERVAPSIPFPVQYVVEPVRGISQARNRALDEAGDAAWIAFVDDDDWPEPDWLTRLLATQARTGADAVLGPTTPVFEHEPPEWIIKGRFFETERFATGTLIPHSAARTGGVLLRRDALTALGTQPFDSHLNFVGGEDVTLFRRLTAHGARIVWDDDALVHEVIPAAKATARWLIARAYRIGITRSATLVIVERAGWARRLKRLGAAAQKVVAGCGELVVARDRARRVGALRKVANGVGLAAGLFGLRYEEYRTIRGT